MIINIDHNNNNYSVDIDKSLDISIPYDFNGEQPNFYDVKKGKIEYLEASKIVYSVKEGASCNVAEIKMNIHCIGTHTECVGHLLKDSGHIGMILTDIFIPTILITLEPKLFFETADTYHCDVMKEELVIAYSSIYKYISMFKNNLPKALVIRTLPNNIQKKTFNYNKHMPPFFTSDAMKLIKKLNIQHLVVDLPSVDRMNDDGILGNHRIFWGNNDDSLQGLDYKSKNTITEFAFIPNSIKDGFYFLNIQIPNFICDAAPSRPLLFKVN